MPCRVLVEAVFLKQPKKNQKKKRKIGGTSHVMDPAKKGTPKSNSASFLRRVAADMAIF